MNRDCTTEQTIDLALWAERIWAGRVVVLKIIVVAIVVGVIVALITPKKYTAKSLLAPESTRSTNNFTSAASILGLETLNLESESDALAVAIYPDIVNSTPFLTQLLKTSVQTTDSKQPISLFDYLQHTLGVQAEQNIDPLHLTKGQAKLLAALRRAITISTDKKSGVTTISATMPDAQVAAMVVRSLTESLQKYVCSYRTSKAQREAEYWEQLYKKRQQQYLDSQQGYADFIDANRSVVLQSVLNERERLQNEKLLAYQLYSSVAVQMQAAQAKVEEVKPLFTIIEPATVPLIPSSTSRMRIVVCFACVGVIIAALWVLFGQDFWRSLRK